MSAALQVPRSIDELGQAQDCDSSGRVEQIEGGILPFDLNYQFVN